MRRLGYILSLFVPVLAVFVPPAYAQSNPDEAPCGLPKWGRIITTVTYDLIDDCAQDWRLEIETAKIPDVPLTLTINGNGHTITYATGLTNRYNFLVVDDEGICTPQRVDTPLSPHIKVIIKDVTFDGGDILFGALPAIEFCGTRYGSGPWILVDGVLEMENVTFTRGNGIWVWAKGKASLNNVLFEDSRITDFGFRSIRKGILHVAKSGSVTLNKAVFRNLERTVIAIDKGGSLSTTGCLSFIRVLTHKAHHSGLWDGYGAWSDSSSGACADETIGNKDKAVVAYAPPTMDCGLPTSGTIEGTVVYTLTQPCTCMNTVNIAEGARVTIHGNDNRIEGCSGSDAHFLIGNAHLTINNAILNNLRVRNYGGQFTLANSMVENAARVAVVNYGRANLLNLRFENNRGDSDSNLYYSSSLFGLGRALFRDNVFSNNSPGDIEAYTTGSGTAIYLCGENKREGTSVLDDDGVEAPLFVAENGGAILDCPDPPPVVTGPQAKRAPFICTPTNEDLPDKTNLGAIGIIQHVQKCPSVVEVWEIMANSQGQFALKANQTEINAVSEGLVACSSNGRVSVRVGLTEPVRQIMAYSKTYVPPSRRGGRDILVSVGPNYEGKVHHVIFDNTLDGKVLGVIDTRPADRPCATGDASRTSGPPAAPAPPVIQPTPIPMAAPVTAQAAQDDGSIVHVVRPGDTIWQIGVAYDVHPFMIMSLNNLDQLSSQGSYLFAGQELLIRPAP